MYQLFDEKVLPSLVEAILMQVEESIAPMNNLTIIDWSKKDEMLNEISSNLKQRIKDFRTDFSYPDKVLIKVKLKSVWNSMLEKEKQNCLSKHFMEGPLGKAIRPDSDDEDDLSEFANSFSGLAARITERIIRPMLIKFNGGGEKLFNIHVKRHMEDSEFPNSSVSFNLSIQSIEIGIKYELAYLYGFLYVLENDENWTILGFGVPKYSLN